MYLLEKSFHLFPGEAGQSAREAYQNTMIREPLHCYGVNSDAIWFKTQSYRDDIETKCTPGAFQYCNQTVNANDIAGSKYKPRRKKEAMVRCDDREKCLRRGGTCAKPNPWIEYLVSVGGQGLSRAAIKQGYAQWKREHVPERLCQKARMRGADFNRKIGRHTHCEFWAGRGARPPNLRSQYDKIRRGMQHGRWPLTHNFNYRELTASHLRKCANLVDKHLCDKTYRQSLNGWTQTWSVEKWEEADDPGPGEVCAMSDVNRRRKTYDISVLQSGLFNLSEDVSQFEGMTPHDRLTMLIVTVAHEMAHVLAVAGGCEGRRQHSVGWDNINRHANGLVYSNTVVDRQRG